jgi:hypothetical protein
MHSRIAIANREWKESILGAFVKSEKISNSQRSMNYPDSSLVYYSR